MGTFKDPINFATYNLNSTTVNVDGEENADGLEMVVAEMDEDEVTVSNDSRAADGIGMFVENPSKTGTVKIIVLDGVPISDRLWAAVKNGTNVSIAVRDVNTEKLKIDGRVMRIVKRPPLQRGPTPDKPEWVLKAVYLTVEGGAMKIVAD